MNYGKLFIKIEDVFFKLGFNEKYIDGKRYLVYKECYCVVSYIKDLSAFVIESADNIEDAKNKVLEDGDLYSIDLPENIILDRVKEDLISDYM